MTFWALAEMVKAQAGILESDSPEQAGEKLRQAVDRYVTDAAEARWVERHLRPLTGLEAEESSGYDRRGESFAAWRRFLEALAEERPLVLVFEDLHWADDALIDFVEHLVDWASGVPVLALCTARPELLARRPGWGGGTVNSSTILLSPLSEEETVSLVHALLGRSTISADLEARLLEHASGNPLYAEEFTRMHAARPRDAVLPETVQGIIAARLDTLPREEKELLQEAAVMGRVFWLGALGRERWTLEERLHRLERKEFVSRQRRSSVAGEEEYAFRHTLMREVAYEQIPKSERARKHFAAAEWIESLGRPEDHAEMLAHHYGAALDYASAAGQETGLFAERARGALRAAGDRAFALNVFPTAARLYGEALTLWPPDDPERPLLLFRHAHALHLADAGAGQQALEDARDALLAANDRERVAEAEALLARMWWFRGRRDQSTAQLERAATWVRRAPASPAKARVLSELARQRMLMSELDEALRVASEALAIAEELGLEEVQAQALGTLGAARSNAGDIGGRADLERSLEIALAIRSQEAQRSYANLGVFFYVHGDLRRAVGFYESALETAARFGNTGFVNLVQGALADQEFHLGRWDEADRYAQEREGGPTSGFDTFAFTARSLMSLARGNRTRATDDAARALALARAAKDPQVLLLALGAAARVHAELGSRDDAEALISELLSELGEGWAPQLRDLVWAAVRPGRTHEVREALLRVRRQSLWVDAYGAVLDGALEAGADLYERIGSLPNEAYARLRAGEKLVAEGRTSDARPQLERSLDFYRRVGATAYAREAEELLVGAGLEVPA